MKFSFSYSRWSVWKECPAKYRYKFIECLPEPKSKAMERGIKVHEDAAAYVEGRMDKVPASLERFSVLATELREWPGPRKMVESQIAFDVDRRRCDWFGPNAYWRFIWDVAAWDAAEQAVNIVDWKTGSPRGSYDEQMQIFALPAYWMFKSLEWFGAHLVYLDTGDVNSMTFTREQVFGPSGDPVKGDGLNGVWLANVSMMASDRAFRPTPSESACKWCAFSWRKGGPCREGV